MRKNASKNILIYENTLFRRTEVRIFIVLKGILQIETNKKQFSLTLNN